MTGASSPWVPLATFGAAVIAAMTALLLAGALTTKGRLNRRLEKEVAIWDKMPPGQMRDDFGQRVTRSAAEVLVRYGPHRNQLLQLELYASVIALGMATFFGLLGVALYGLTPGKDDRFLYFPWLFLPIGVVSFMGVAGWVWIQAQKHVRDFVTERLAGDDSET